MPRKKSTILVEFIDAASGRPVSSSRTKIDALPDAFDTEREVVIDGKSWEFLEAVPVSKTEFAKTGRVEIRLRDLGLIDPNKVLFSLPTLDTALPKIDDDECPREDRLIIHEDDWRQIEFVSTSHLSGIESELRSIEKIFQGNRVGRGFREIHTRREIGAPLFDTLLAFGKARPKLGSRQEFKGVSFAGIPSSIEKGFAFETEFGMTFYGQQSDGVVKSLCRTMRNNSGRDLNAAAKRLAGFTAANNLVYVDWCWMVALNGNEKEFLKHFSECEEA